MLNKANVSFLQYNEVLFFLDVADGIRQYPEFVSFGGNTGTVNSFTPINLGDLTGGLYNVQELFVPQKAQCFFHDAMLAFIPDLLAPLLRTALATIFTPLGLGCPVLATYWDAEVFKPFPGSHI